MRSKKWLVGIFTVAITLMLALVGCSSDSEQSQETESTDSGSYTLVTEGVLTVAASLDFPPFENLNGDTPEGFAVDLMYALAEEMGLECVYLPSTKFDTIIPLISSGGTADVGSSSFTITEERKVEIDFTDSYMDSNQGIVVMQDSGYESVDDLSGMKIAAQSGTTGYDWACENIDGAEVIAFDEMTAVFAALQSGQVDAVAADLPVVQYYIKDAYSDAEVIAEIPTGEQYGLVVSQDNPELTAALNEALAELKSNGTYDEIYENWFGVASS